MNRPQFLSYEDGEFNGPSEFEALVYEVWWLSNLEADRARLKTGAPDYMKAQLASRQGRNGRGRIWVDQSFGGLALPRYVGLDDSPAADALPGGIVLRPGDGKFAVGGFVRLEEMVRHSDLTAAVGLGG